MAVLFCPVPTPRLRWGGAGVPRRKVLPHVKATTVTRPGSPSQSRRDVREKKKKMSRNHSGSSQAPTRRLTYEGERVTPCKKEMVMSQRCDIGIRRSMRMRTAPPHHVARRSKRETGDGKDRAERGTTQQGGSRSVWRGASSPPRGRVRSLFFLRSSCPVGCEDADAGAITCPVLPQPRPR